MSNTDKSELERLYRCVMYDKADGVDREEMFIKEVGVVVETLGKARDAAKERDITRFEVIDHRECVWCRGRKTANYLQKDGDYKEMPCGKCDGSGMMGGRVYVANSNAETSSIQVQLSYQDDGQTLKVFVNDKQSKED